MNTSAVDLMSELPEAILHHILSYLPIKEAARTSVLSKWWNNAWETLPYLNFNDESFMIHNTDYLWQIEKNRDLLAVVQRIVRNRQQQQINIEKFNLYIPPWQDEYLSSDEEEDGEEGKKKSLEIGLSSFSVISYVSTPSLRELKLINGITGNPNLCLPSSILSAKRLTSLTLNGFDLYSSWSLLDIKFICLRKLVLQYVVVDDSIVENLTLGSCSSLETLKLYCCTGLKTIDLGGKFAKLKRLMVLLDGANGARERSIDLPEVSTKVYDAPEFQELHLLGYFYFNKHYVNVENCHLLRKVFIHSNFITENILHKLLDSSKCLEELSISSCSLLKNINIFSDSLKTLSLSSLDNLKKLHIVSPTLKSFTFELSNYVPDFSFNGSDEGVRVNLIIYDQFSFRCVKFLQYFKHTKMMTIKGNQLVIIPEYTRVKLLSPLYGTRDISFSLQEITKVELMKQTFRELVEYLLWLAPRAESVSILSRNSTTLLSLELVYHHNEEEKRNFNCCYCKLLPIDCWRHCLKEIRIHKFDGCEYDLIMMKKFFDKQIKNLKIIDNVCQQQTYNETNFFYYYG